MSHLVVSIPVFNGNRTCLFHETTFCIKLQCNFITESLPPPLFLAHPNKSRKYMSLNCADWNTNVPEGQWFVYVPYYWSTIIKIIHLKKKPRGVSTFWSTDSRRSWPTVLQLLRQFPSKIRTKFTLPGAIKHFWREVILLYQRN